MPIIGLPFIASRIFNPNSGFFFRPIPKASLISIVWQRTRSMNSIEEFRYKSHQLLLELDAATTRMMMLVALHEVSGPVWNEAYQDHCNAYKAWNDYVNTPFVVLPQEA